ncbi:unnamed protein product [Dracunculus medinensis]|uniref:Uncharacterized protein n=1 Tax=Dracunculus medinensis TaxID=318479 RepID=A0A3P7PN41_DRAME|nr:unnamed protein product [Dracunculus medinensis]
MTHISLLAKPCDGWRQKRGRPECAGDIGNRTLALSHAKADAEVLFHAGVNLSKNPGDAVDPGSTPEREPEKRLPLPRKAAGAQITHSQQEEVVTKNNETVLIEAGYRNGYNLNLLTRTYERASLVPAAAVTPALKVYIVIAAVKKLVVGIQLDDMVHLLDVNYDRRLIYVGFPCVTLIGRVRWYLSEGGYNHVGFYLLGRMYLRSEWLKANSFLISPTLTGHVSQPYSKNELQLYGHGFSSLWGEALRAVRGYDIAPENYQVIVLTFGDTSTIKKSLYNELHTIKRCDRDWKMIVESIERILRQLEAIGENLKT